MGRIDSDYYNEAPDRHSRLVTRGPWRELSDVARNEFSARAAFFMVRRNSDEFLEPLAQGA